MYITEELKTSRQNGRRDVGLGESPIVDNASSVLIPLRRYGQSSLAHNYEIEYKGKIIRCRTESALVRALGVLEADENRSAALWSAEEFTDFTNRIRTPQRRLLGKLLECGPAMLMDEKLRADLGISNNQALAGVLSGISKTALAMDLDPTNVYLSRTRYRNGKPIHAYRIASEFLRAAKKLGWPKEEDLKTEDSGAR
jgi:hypothetical protein